MRKSDGMTKLLLLLLPFVLWAQKPDLFLLKKYTDQNVTGWYMSEKLDGIRAYWDGKKLYSRGGHVLHAPSYFTKNFPPFKLDGELWSGRGEFEYISSVVRDKTPSDEWKQITYNIFEAPNQEGNLTSRLLHVKKYEGKYLKLIEQIKVKNALHIKAFKEKIEQLGGEGVVVRNPNSSYITKRTDMALKIKSFEDTECKVLSYNKGKGKYSAVMGSLRCQLGNGIIFKIGTGFSDKERKNPPKIGSTITFKYQGFTKNKKPRFAVFMRERLDDF